MLDRLPNTFEGFNRVRCFNHTIQLSAKALLKPFYSAGLIETDDETDDGIAPQAMDDNEEKEEEDDHMDDELGDEEEEDPLDAMDNDKRESLIKNTEAVRTTLLKVSLYASIISLFLCSLYHYRFVNYPSLLSIPLPLPSLHGMMPALLILSMYDLSHVMSRLNGIPHMTC